MTAPLVSIVTPTYNSAATLRHTVESVLVQTYPHIEYIIVDGASTDGTAALLAEYADHPGMTIISEPDDGQSDAINKGWRAARGDVLAWLCADDRYLPHTVATAMATMTAQPDVMWVYGHNRYINRDGEPVPFVHPTAPFDYAAYRAQHIHISQPTTLWRRELIERYGMLREDLHYTMDMEFYLRTGREHPGWLIDEVLALVTWTRDTKTFGGGVARMQEIEAVIRQYGGAELAPTLRAQWAEAHLEASVRHLRDGQPGKAGDALRGAGRFPAQLPKAAAKLLLRYGLPEATETRLRRLLLRG